MFQAKVVTKKMFQVKVVPKKKCFRLQSYRKKMFQAKVVTKKMFQVKVVPKKKVSGYSFTEKKNVSG